MYAIPALLATPETAMETLLLTIMTDLGILSSCIVVIVHMECPHNMVEPGIVLQYPNML
jgi:hypothetical protein